MDRRGHGLDACAQLAPRAAAATGGVGERVAQLVGVLRDVRGARLGERREAAPAVGRELDEPLVLEQVQGRVDRAGARAPLALAALRDLLDDLVPVHGLLGEEQQDGGADVAAAGAPGAATAAPVPATAVTGAEAGPARAEPGASRAEPATVVGRTAGAEAPAAVGRSAEPASATAAGSAAATGAVAAEPARVVGHGREAVATTAVRARPGSLAERLGHVLDVLRGPAPVLVCVVHERCLLYVDVRGLRVIRGAWRAGPAARSSRAASRAQRYGNDISIEYRCQHPRRSRAVPGRAHLPDVR